MSVKVVVLNEERHLAECLDTVSFADEIVVVDSHSTDATPDIARRHGARYVDGDYRGIDDKKRAALALCTREWVFSIDADERVTPDLRAEIERVIAAGCDGSDVNGYYVRRRSRHMGRWIRFGEWGRDDVLRLVRRRAARYEGLDPHPKLVVTGRTERFRGLLLHHAYRDFAHQVATVQRYSELVAADMHARGQRYSFRAALLRPIFRFLKSYVWQLGFLDGLPGLAIAYSSLYYDFAKYVKLREMEIAEASAASGDLTKRR